MKSKSFYNSSLTSKILKTLFSVGIICFAAQSPYFLPALWKDLRRRKHWRIRERDKINKEKFQNVFYYLRMKGYIDIKKANHQIYISLTPEGKKRARKYQIDDLKIETPSRWDKRWRLVIFDIPNIQGIKREVFRGKLKEFGFYPLQKSVWVYPYECDKEIKLLRDFFGLTPKHLRIIKVEKLEDDNFLRKKFKLQ